MEMEELNHALAAPHVSTLAEMTVQGFLLAAEREKKRQRDVLAGCTKQASAAPPAVDSSLHGLACSPAAPAAVLHCSASARHASPELPERPHNKLLKNLYSDKTVVVGILGAHRSEYRGRVRPLKSGHVHDVHTPSRFMVQIDLDQNLQLFVLPKGVEKFFKGTVPQCIKLRTSIIATGTYI
ncbi:uncharacterized protein [Triticum aestivum]|uniref:uncharacterized protein n=1 Tax=Triticum aestivum TaxID=4565 RepID=UPI001D008E06|nr:uncharacterized protein LOC123130431 [Triticum aestivum]